MCVCVCVFSLVILWLARSALCSSFEFFVFVDVLFFSRYQNETIYNMLNKMVHNIIMSS